MTDTRIESWDLIIQPKRSLLALNLRDLWAYRDLLLMFVKRDIVTVYQQTVLGPIWFFIQPLATMLTYVIVFSQIANLSTDGIPPPLFYLTGIIIWNYFQDCLTKTSSTFASNAGIFGKVYFPRLIVPISQVASGLLKLCIQGILFLIVYIWFLATTESIGPNIWILGTLYCVALMAGLGLGMGIILSSLTTKYRDLTFLLTFAIQLTMYATPIIYPMSILSENARYWMWWNPISHVIEAFKYGLLGSGTLTLSGLAYTTVFTVVVLLLGIVIFNRTEQTFMDTV
jgi:lipopolysaccharide transport system permease protein